MSAYAPVKTEFNDKECLLAALADNEVRSYKNVEVHEKPVNLVGFHGDLRQQTAEIVIRRKDIDSASNDIGFAKAEDGTYTAIISDYDSHQHNGKWMTAVKASYATKRFEKTAQGMGLKFLSREKVNGKMVTKYLKVGA